VFRIAAKPPPPNDDDEEIGVYADNQMIIVGLLTVIQFFLGAFYAVITTGYYSLATLIFTEKESAMSSVETDVEEQGLELSEMESIMGRQSTNGHARERTATPQVSAISLLKFPKILLGALTLCWVDVTWSFMEPLLSKQLDHNFDVSMSEIGMIFSISSIVYVPMVYLVQFLPSQGKGRHRTISIAVMLTPLAVLLVGSNSLAVLIMGVTLNGILPTPVWVHLLPWMQEEALKLFPDPNTSRRVNDLTATIYNSFLTLGQVVGYITGPLLASRGFARTTQMVALLTFIQSILFFFGAGGFLPEDTREHSRKFSADAEDKIVFLPEEKGGVRRKSSRGSEASNQSAELEKEKIPPKKKRDNEGAPRPRRQE